MSNKISCPECEKSFRTESGLNWHLEHVHEKTREAEAASQVSNDGLDEPVNDTIRLEDIAVKVARLEDMVSKLSQDVELSKVIRDADRADFNKRIEEVERKFEDDLNSLAAVVNRYRDAFNHGLADMESRIAKVQKMVEGLGEGLSAVRTKLATHGHDDLKPIPELVAKVGKIEQTLGSMQSQVEYLGRVAKREPTRDTERIGLTNGHDHTFRVYRSSRGLTRPHKVASDLILGDKYVDLAEPED